MEYTTGSVVFNDWIITREIGQGATGKVFEIEKRGYGITVKSALKVIRIPKSLSDIQAVRNEGMTMASVEDYFREFVDEILREVRIMVSLKEHPNIVSYEDHCVVPHESEVGWDVLIKMELLTPLSEWQGTHQMDEQTVIRLGKEISSALAYAAEHDLIHRDVKPENIFVNEAGKFKLGDFGIARTIEKTTGGLSKKGTESYMAPEVYHGNPYSRQVDIYSLGIVLYRFLNENRLPFYPPAPQVIKYSDRETAIIKRMGGMELPEPKNGSTEIKRIVQKACQYLPEKRYATMNELFNDLQQCNSTGNESKWKTYQKPAEQQPEIQKAEEKNPLKQNQKEENRDAVVSRIQEEYAESVKVNKQETLHTKKPKEASEKTQKFAIRKVVLTCVLAGMVALGILYIMSAISGSNAIEIKELQAEEMVDRANAFFENEQYEDAVKLYQAAADQRNAEALYQLSLCYYNAYGVEEDKEKSFELTRESAELGNADAQYQLGYFYHSGDDGFTQDYEEAVKWYKKAAEQNYAKAQCNLAYCYMMGYGGDVDVKEVAELFKKAADQADPPAEYYLGWCYENGYGIDTDYEQALYWYKEAANQGIEGAEEAANELEKNMEEKQPNWYCVYNEEYNVSRAVRRKTDEKSKALTWLKPFTYVYIEKYDGNWGFTTKDGVSGWMKLDELEEVVDEDEIKIMEYMESNK